ncbi:MAG: hypothetical protein FWG87_12740 [Defluviitaleaceae bacterium]|nr:hypothetical protein [Defluviitaleaceae bacterium]
MQIPTTNARIAKARRFFVGDELARPEVCTFVNSGRITSINAERGNLGTDKSVPYKKTYKSPQKTAKIPQKPRKSPQRTPNPPPRQE